MKSLSTLLVVIPLAIVAVTSLGGCSYAPPAHEEEYDGAYDDQYVDDDGYYDEHQGPPYNRVDAPPDEEFGDLWYWGDWLAVEPYGWVWKPNVVMSWSPFRHGNWVYTDWGWTWVSYEPFGWAVYHYGYWVYDAVWGWIWLPDFEWHPAPVEWVVYDNYVSWAPWPLPGQHLRDPWYTHSDDMWVIVDADHFMSTDVGRFSRPSHRSKPAPKYKVKHAAPEVTLIEETTGEPVRATPLEMQRVKYGTHALQKMRLPAPQRRTIEQYQPRVEQKILKKKSPPTKDLQREQPKEKERRETKPEQQRQKEKPKSKGDKNDGDRSTSTKTKRKG